MSKRAIALWASATAVIGFVAGLQGQGPSKAPAPVAVTAKAPKEIDTTYLFHPARNPKNIELPDFVLNRSMNNECKNSYRTEMPLFVGKSRGGELYLTGMLNHPHGEALKAYAPKPSKDSVLWVPLEAVCGDQGFTDNTITQMDDYIRPMGLVRATPVDDYYVLTRKGRPVRNDS